MSIKCGKSQPELRLDLKRVSTVPVDHAGTLTHICDGLQGHTEEYCVCRCGYYWRAIGEPKRITTNEENL